MIHELLARGQFANLHRYRLIRVRVQCNSSVLPCYYRLLHKLLLNLLYIILSYISYNSLINMMYFRFEFLLCVMKTNY